jgi:hypothetical protein
MSQKATSLTVRALDLLQSTPGWTVDWLLAEKLGTSVRTLSYVLNRQEERAEMRYDGGSKYWRARPERKP